jgi:hypothetical protein
MEKTVFVLTGAEGVAEGFVRGPSTQATEVPVETLKSRLENLSAQLQDIMPDKEARHNGFQLQSFTVAVGIDAKGTVGFLGTGASVGSHATFTLRFERAAKA